MSTPDEGKPSLTLVATPIGNLGDLSPRAKESLESAELWLVEDTRVSGKLSSHLGIRKPMRVVNEHTSDHQLEKIISEIQDGKKTVLLSDGGAPTISDPGSRLADLAHDAGIAIDAIPGPSAVVTALMLSGFFAQRFAFLGFLPRKPGDIKKEIEPFLQSTLTLVMFESPFRITQMLEILSETLGPRRYAVCREMTKMFQQVYRGEFPEIPTEAQVPHKGEFTIVIEGHRRRKPTEL